MEAAMHKVWALTQRKVTHSWARSMPTRRHRLGNTRGRAHGDFMPTLPQSHQSDLQKISSLIRRCLCFDSPCLVVFTTVYSLTSKWCAQEHNQRSTMQHLSLIAYHLSMFIFIYIRGFITSPLFIAARIPVPSLVLPCNTQGVYW